MGPAARQSRRVERGPPPASIDAETQRNRPARPSPAARGRAIVIGGGLIGVTTAYELVRRGVPTLLLEAREGVALETSHANGATLTPSMSDPWNSPGVHRHLLGSLLDPYSPMKLRLGALPSLAGWGIQFLRNSTPLRHRAATQASFRLAQYSVEKTRELSDRLGLKYEAARKGSLKVVRHPAGLEGPLAAARMLGPLGLRFELLDAEAAVELEPALAPIRPEIAGALHYPDDMVGDAYLFCRELLGAFRAAGGEIRTGVTVSGLSVTGGQVRGVRLAEGYAEADIVVVAAASASCGLLKPLGLRLPIRPVKGYTVTFPGPADRWPSIPVVDDALHAIVVPLGDRLRVAGTAEFAGEDRRIRGERIENLLRLLQRIYPDLARRLDPRAATRWTGLRPMSADGLPFVGSTGIEGLFVNAGHGHLGWTCAVGSSRLLADAVTSAQPEIDPASYRVGPTRRIRP